MSNNSFLPECQQAWFTAIIGTPYWSARTRTTAAYTNHGRVLKSKSLFQLN